MKTLALLLGIMAALSGCGDPSDWFDGEPPSPPGGLVSNVKSLPGWHVMFAEATGIDDVPKASVSSVQAHDELDFSWSILDIPERNKTRIAIRVEADFDRGQVEDRLHEILAVSGMEDLDLTPMWENKTSGRGFWALFPTFDVEPLRDLALSHGTEEISHPGMGRAIGKIGDSWEIDYSLRIAEECRNTQAGYTVCARVDALDFGGFRVTRTDGEREEIPRSDAIEAANALADYYSLPHPSWSNSDFKRDFVGQTWP